MVIDIFLLGQGRNDNPSENYVKPLVKSVFR